MLVQLTVQNLAIAESLELNFKSGMTVISGETGAGKSILLQALGLILGDKTDSDKVRFGTNKADISAIFDVTNLPSAQTWLSNCDLDNDKECIIRRTISKEGRSRAYINGCSVPAAQLKEIGGLLMDIHSQHQHHHLLNPKTHLDLIDEYAQHAPLLKKVQHQYNFWHEQHKRLDELANQQQQQQDHIALLKYQIAELDELQLHAEELESLEEDQVNLSSAEQILNDSQQANHELSNDRGIRHQLTNIVKSLSQYQHKDLVETTQMLDEALIQVIEAANNLDFFAANIEMDPNKLLQIEERLSTLYALAKKHQVAPDELYNHHQDLKSQLAALDISDEDIAQLQADCDSAKANYLEVAGKLTAKRQKAISKFDKEVKKQLALLNMSSANFETQLTQSDNLSGKGMDNVEFFVSANAGQPVKPLAKTASGGELSRISLAIQVICAQNSVIPVLVFDEVDVGISGATSEVVGKLLRHLGSRGQIMCISHQPQVVAQAHQHLHVSKSEYKGETKSKVSLLSETEKVAELARLLGGIEITDHTLAHAQEMLSAAQQTH